METQHNGMAINYLKLSERIYDQRMNGNCHFLLPQVRPGPQRFLYYGRNISRPDVVMPSKQYQMSNCPLSPINMSWAVLIVWRIRGKIIGTVQRYTVYHNNVHCYCAVLTGVQGTAGLGLV